MLYYPSKSPNQLWRNRRATIIRGGGLTSAMLVDLKDFTACVATEMCPLCLHL